MTKLVGTDEAGTLPYRRVLVTGGTGFVGRHLMPRLSAILASDAVLCLAGRTASRPSVTDGFGFVEFDLSNPATIGKAIEAVRPDLIIHLAGEASVGVAEANAAGTWRLNAIGALEIASAISAAALETTMFYVSSAEIYGQAFLGGIASEKSVAAPVSVYAQSKLAAEQILSHTLPGHARLVVARPSNHIGPGQDMRFVMPAFAAQIAAMEIEGATTIRVGNLESRRDFMDVRDTVDAYLAMLSVPVFPAGQKIFNVSSGRTRSVGELLEMMRHRATVKTDVEIDEQRFRPAEIPLAEVDSSRLRETTGWFPTIPIEQTVADVLDDWRVRWKG